MFRLLQIAKVQVLGMGDRIGGPREPMIGNQRLNRTKSQEQVVSEPKVSAPPEAPPLPGPKELTSEQQERILKSGIAISNLVDEKLSVIEPKDRELLTNLMARVTGPDKHQPSLDEIKEVQRIVSGFHENVMSRWQEGTQSPEEVQQSHNVQGRQHSGLTVDKRSRVSSESLEALNELDKNVSKKQMEVALTPQEQQVEEPKEPKAPRPKAPQLSEVISDKSKGELTKLRHYQDEGVKGYNRQALTQMIKFGCGDIVAERQKAILPSSKEKAYQAARELGENLTYRINKDSTFLTGLKELSSEERRKAISEAIGDVEGKDKLVNAILEGVEKALDQPPNPKEFLTNIVKDSCGDLIKGHAAVLPGDKEQALKTVREQAEKAISELPKSYLVGLKDMSSSERKQAIGEAVGNVEGKEELIKAILDGYDKAQSNVPRPEGKRFSPETWPEVKKDTLQQLTGVGKDYGRQMIKGIEDKEQLSGLVGKSDEQLKYEVGKALGFDDQQIGSLLPAHKQLIESVVAGVREELQAMHLGPQQQEVDSLVKQITDRPRPLAPLGAMNMAKAFVAQSSEDVKFGLTLKSKDELQQMVMLALGEPGKDVKALPEDKQKQINAIVEGIQKGLPNKVGDMKTIKGDKGKDIEVPSTISVNGRTYGDPVYLAEGGFGRVFKYTDAETGKSVVVKDLLDPEQRQNMVRELQIHREAMGPDGQGHENLVGLQGAVQGPGDRLYMVMDHVDGPNLHELKNALQDMKKLNLLSPSDDMLVRQFLGKGIIDGLIHMHDQGVVHGDFKSPNSMYDRNNGQSKVIDLGTGKIDPQSIVTDEIKGEVDNPMWKAPELSKKGSTFDERVDSFSLGQTLHELVKGDIYFTSDFLAPIEEKHQSMMESGEKAMQGTQTSFTEVINSTFAGRQEDRAKLEEVRKNPFFTDPLGSDERAQALLNKICDLNSLNKKIGKLEDQKVDPNDPDLQKLKTDVVAMQKELREMSARRNLGHE